MTLKAPLRSILGGAAGNLVEWFDWYVYSAFSLYFAKAFFPGQDQTAQFLATSGIFWVGFLMRPIGGWLLGRIGDRHGRRTALAWSVALMGGGSLMLAATPVYASIGIAAPILLMLARIIQGLSLGGEYGAAATYLSEIAPEGRRGFWSSFQYVTLYGGQLLALALLLGLQAGGAGEAALSSWGWRLAFVVGAVLALGIYWLRRGIDETPEFQAEAAPERRAGGIADLWRNHRRSVLIAFGLAVGSNVAFYTYTTYMQKYLVGTSGFAKPVASQICAVATILAILLQPVLGGLSDRIGRKPLLYWFAIGGILATVPLMTAIGKTHDPLIAFALVLAALVILSGATSTSAIVKAELFPPHVRALGVGLPYALSQSLFGGSAEALALKLKQVGHESYYFWYVSAMIGVALAATIAMTRDRKAAEYDRTCPPRVAVLDFPFPWTPGAPLPTLLQNEEHAFLLFLTTEDDHGIGLVEFESCLAASFGSPGDETFHGHPLYSAGLRRYEAMEVFNSPWIAQLQKIDSVHPRHHPSTYADFRHFVFAFHDTTFECVAAGFTATRTEGPLSDAVKRVAARLL